MSAEIVRRYGQLAAAGIWAACAATDAGAVGLAETPPALQAYAPGAAAPPASFTVVSLRVSTIGETPLGIASAPEPTADSSARTAALAFLGGQSSVPDNSPALSLTGGLLAIGMVLRRRGRQQG
jgi:hypothetical protein